MADDPGAFNPWSPSDDEAEPPLSELAPPVPRFLALAPERHMRRALRWSGELIDDADLVDWPPAFDALSALARVATYVAMLQRMVAQEMAEHEQREHRDAGRKPN